MSTPPMREISHDEAGSAAQRIINSAFRNGREGMRASIPANPDRDDDLLLCAYIGQQRARELPMREKFLEAVIRDAADALERRRDPMLEEALAILRCALITTAAGA